jgi:hypothetical protein
MNALLKVFVVAAVALLLFGCTQTTSSQSFELKNAFTIKENSSYYNSAEDINISIASFADSTCRKGVECIWSGEQGVSLLISASGQDFNIYLGRVTAPKKSFTTLSGKSFEVSLVSIDVDKGEAQIAVTRTT